MQPVKFPIGEVAQLAGDDHRLALDAQELDSTASTGAIYWEGLSALHDDAGRHVGLGYLEMTGHARPLRLSSHVHGGLGPALA